MKVIISLGLIAAPIIGLPIPLLEAPMDAFLARYVDRPETVTLAFGIPLAGTIAATSYGIKVEKQRKKNETERAKMEETLSMAASGNTSVVA